jgi:hypothetical protein
LPKRIEDFFKSGFICDYFVLGLPKNCHFSNKVVENRSEKAIANIDSLQLIFCRKVFWQGRVLKKLTSGGR